MYPALLLQCGSLTPLVKSSQRNGSLKASSCRQRRLRVLCAHSDGAHGASLMGAGFSCWTVAQSASLYNVAGWGAPYFAASDALDGRVVLHPFGDDDADSSSRTEVDLFAVATAVRERLGSGGPVVLRFPDVACRQAAKLQSVFDEAINTWGYSAGFQGVFPVKCCHDETLLISLVADGARNGFGLEAGSKPELLLALAVLQRAKTLQPKTERNSKQDVPAPLLVCNGYKDDGYIQLAISSSSLGLEPILVLEKPSELAPVIAAVMALPENAHRPSLGIRARLGTSHDGQWGATSGDDAKFGLGAREILWAVQTLAEENMLDCLRMLHFHIGSQVSDIATIKEAMRESSQMYAELVRLGAPMGLIDVGGGLGVDYNGTKGWGGHMSTNYSMQNYANDVVAALKDMCTRTGVKPPVVVSESGRAIVSSSAVVVFEVISTQLMGPRVSALSDEELKMINRAIEKENASTAKTTVDQLRVMDPSSFLLHNFRAVLSNMITASDAPMGNIQESLNDAAQFRQEADRLFRLGIMGLEGRAEAEELFASVRGLAFELARRIPEGEVPSKEVLSASRQPTAWYHANMSVFRSLPDSWAIGQLFPIVPLHRLAEAPTIAGSLADLTCDSDGRIDRFVGPAPSNISNLDRGRPLSFLPLHPLRDGETYLVAAFLVGAYQESMGSRGHNLFGSPCVANVSVTRGPTSQVTSTRVKIDEQRFQFGDITVTLKKGQTTADVLRDAGSDPEELLKWMSDNEFDCENKEFFGRYEAALFNSYTYLE